MPVDPAPPISALTASEVARRLDVRRTTVDGWISSGKLPFVEVHGTKHILVGAYERFAERRAKRETLEEQAARYIGAGVEVEGDADSDAKPPSEPYGPR